VGDRYLVFFPHVLQGGPQKADLSREQARTLLLPPLHVAEHNKPECYRASRKLCPTVKSRDRNGMTVVKDLQVPWFQSLIRQSILPGDYIY